MSDLAQLLLAAGVIFAINLLPAFGPPTWSVLVFFSLDFELPAVPLVLLGAAAAAPPGSGSSPSPPCPPASSSPGPG